LKDKGLARRSTTKRLPGGARRTITIVSRNAARGSRARPTAGCAAKHTARTRVKLHFGRRSRIVLADDCYQGVAGLAESGNIIICGKIRAIKHFEQIRTDRP
jgi:hypothetical protein